MADKDDLKILKEVADTLKEIQESIAENNALREKGSKASKDEFFEQKKLYTIYKEKLKLTKDLSFFNKDSLQNFIETGKRLKDNNTRIKEYKKEVQRIVDLGEKATEQEKELLDILNRKITSYQAANAQIRKSITATTKWGAGLKLAAQAVDGIGAAIKSGYGMIKGSGLFTMDKAIKSSALSMGILSKQSGAFADQITGAANDTIEFGVGIEDLAKAQASYSSSMGRTVILGKQAAKQLGAMAASTGLGAEGAGEFAGDMDRIGMSAERTAEYVEQTMNDAHAMGLNASKVIKTIAANIKLLNKYNFKGGSQGLAKMAQETQKMGIELGIAAPLAEKVFNVEGAVEMSAQLQVLGGEWSKLADPFKLMYMARNDMEGLTKAVIKATTATATFNKETGEFDISSLEMQRLRQVAEATGLDFEQLAQAAKKAAQFAGIKKQISYGFDKKTEEFIESTAFLNKTGRASIDIDGKGTTKFINELNAADKKTLMARADEKEDMATRAKNARTFDDALNNTITLFKQILLPIVTTLNEKLMPKVDTFVKNIVKSDWIGKLTDFAKTIGNVASYIGSFILNYPKLSLGLVLGSKALGFLMEKASWFSNGLALAQGFNVGTGSAGGGAGSMLTKNLTRLGGIATALVAGVTTFMQNQQKGMPTGQNVVRSSLTGVGSGLGAWGAASLGASIGAAGGPVGMAIGALIGGAIGAWGGGKIGNALGDAVYGDPNAQAPVQTNDGVIQFNPKDKFTKVDDGTMVAGTNVNGNKDLARQLAARPTALTPANQNQMPSNMNITFSQLTLGGSIELKLNGNYSKEMGKELIQNPAFIRDLTKLIHMETEKNLNSGKPKG